MNSRSARRRPEESSFFISLNDLLVGVLFLFIILMMTFALRFNVKRSELEQLLVERTKARTELLERLQKRLQQRPGEITIDRESGVLRFNANLLFADNDDRLKPAGKLAMYKLSKALAEELPCFSLSPVAVNCPNGKKLIFEAVYVEGHTDMRPPRAGTKFRTNWELSSARAIAAYNELLGPQASLEKLENPKGEPLLGASAYADKRPVNKVENFDENRRVEFRFLLSSVAPDEIAAAAK